MTRILRAVEIVLMTGDAGGRQACKDVILVAHVAADVSMRTCQGELRGGVVIKCRICPRRCAVADRTILRETCRCMARVFGRVKVR